MTTTFDTALLTLGGSVALSIVAKVTVIVAMTLIGASLARRYRAAARHLMFAAVFAVLLLLPVASLIGPTLPVEIATASPVAPAIAPVAIVDATAEPRSSSARAPWGTLADSAPDTSSNLTLATSLGAVWAAGVLWSLVPVAAAFWQMRRLRRISEFWPAGSALAQQLAREAGMSCVIDVRVRVTLPGPVTYGVVRPVIILPTDTLQWEDEDVDRALTHELEHVRRGDWWTQAAARIVCALYWFHPLVWMARRRLILEAERACDDAVLARAEPTAYAEQLVRLAQRLSARTRQPMPAMANHRGDLRVRIDAVLDAAQARGPANTASATLTLVVAVALGVGVAPLRTVARADTLNDIGRDVVLEPAPRQDGERDAEERRPSVDAPVVRPVARSSADRVERAQGQPGAVDRPRFAEATITPCGTASGGRNGGPGSAGPPSTGVLGMGCRSVAEMIRRSHGYGEHAGVPVEGAPSWVVSDQYQITVRAEGNPSMSMTMGPMLQTLLEDRFKLRLRRDTRNVSGYALTVADAGHTLTEAACEPPRRPPVANLPPPEKPCHWSLVTSVRGPNGTAGAKWVSTEEFAGLLSNVLGRPVVDQTGINVRFDARLEFAPEGTMVERAINDPRFVRNPPGVGDGPTAPVIFTAIEEQLGLRLEPATVPTDVFVVEHVERPSDN